MSFLPQEIIRKKRDGEALTAEEIQYFVRQIAQGQISDVQISAFLMAVYFNDMSQSERNAFTLALRDSGEILNWKDIKPCSQLNSAPIIDKHSTGGVGDLVSLACAPLLAACGAYVPMIAGRALGYTGGTLDKLESIPGFKVQLNNDDLKRIINNVGCAIIGQNETLAPVDKKIYAIRDVSATVSSTALITTSLLAKKLAAGLSGLVVDIKVGNGTFVKSMEHARNMAQSLTEIANASGCPTRIVITDMNQPLASSAGNALEIAEAVRFLRKEVVNPRLKDVIFALSTEALLSVKLAETPEQAKQKLQEALDSGRAVERFDNMVIAQGGPDNFCSTYKSHLRRAPVIKPLFVAQEGILQKINTKELGWAIVKLGGGRRNLENHINRAVGFNHIAPIGAYLGKDTPLVTIHAETEDDWQMAAERYLSAITIGETTPSDQEVIYEYIH